MGTTLLVFRPLGADYTAVNALSLGSRNQHRFISYPASAVRESFWTSIMPAGYVQLGLTVQVKWTSPAVAGDAVWGVSLERHDAATDLDADSFAAEKVVVSTALGTSGFEQTAEVAFLDSEIDGIQPGEKFRIRVRQLGTDSSYTLADIAELSLASIKQDSGPGGGGGGGGGFFTDGAGTNAVIGQGFSTPVASGARAFAHGTYVDVSGNDSLALGDTIDLDGSNSLAIGKDITIDSVSSDQVCVVGRYIDAQFASSSLLVGFRLTAFGGQNLMVGSELYALSSAQTLALIGFDNTSNGDFSFIQGRANTIADLYGFCFIQGRSNYIYPYSGYSFVQGFSNLVREASPRAFVQGSNNSLDDSPNSFNQGYLCKAYDIGNMIGNNLVQGYFNTIYGDHCLFQGSQLKMSSGQLARKSFLQGTGFTLTGFSIFNSLMQGQSHVLTEDISQCLVQGLANTLDGLDTLVVGNANTSNPPVGSGFNAIVGNDNIINGNNILAVGSNNDILGTPASNGSSAAIGLNNAFAGGLKSFAVVGQDNNGSGLLQSDGFILGEACSLHAAISGTGIWGSGCYGYGDNGLIGGSLSAILSGDQSIAIGYYCKVTGNQAAALGWYCYASDDNTFAHGFFARAIRPQQRVWSSDVDKTQKSHIVKKDQTIDAIQQTMLTFNLELGKAYSIKINLVAKNATTVAEIATFVSTQEIAYREAGTAVLQGSPVALTNVNTGGGAANLLADLIQSGNNVLLRITGEAGQTYNWGLDFEFMETSD